MVPATAKPSRLQLVITCLSITANSLCAGGIFMFPIFSPALSSLLKLTQPQLTTVVLAGVVGQYPFSPVVGKVIDLYGPSTSSFISATLFCISFMASAMEITTTPVDITEPSSDSFHRLTFFFLLAGLGTVFSYFSSIFAASKAFPDHPGLTSGFSMAIFGLSPLCLSIVASRFFTEPDSGQLDIVLFLKFMALLTASCHILGAFAYRSNEAQIRVSIQPGELHGELREVNEHSQLLPQKPGPPKEIDDEPTEPHPLRDPTFWLLGVYCLLGIGASEMVISNIGTIVLSLPPFGGLKDAASATSTQVRILSISNTVSRLFAGLLADFLSPVPSHMPNGTIVYPRKHRASRILFLSGPALLLGISFLWMELGVRSRDIVWTFSVGIGISYGVMFTVLPSIILSIWGARNLGRNFGIMTYAPFIGTPLFSYLYAFVSAASSQEPGICKGVSCWQTTLWVSSGTSMVAFIISTILWKKWQGRV